MITVTAKEAKNRLGEVLRQSQRSPVEITHHGKPFAYMVSRHDFHSASGAFTQEQLDRLKHLIACELVAQFSIDEIRVRSLENLDRWETSGLTGQVYDEWRRIMKTGSDRQVLSAMIGTSEESNRLRQSPPYVGMLERGAVESLREKVAP